MVSLQIEKKKKSPYGELSVLKVFFCKTIVTILFQMADVPRTTLLHISMDSTAAKLIKNW